MAQSLNYRAPERSKMVPVFKENAFPGQKYAESPISQADGGSRAPFGKDVMPTNASNATPAKANKLQEAIKHVGRAKASGTSKGPKC